MPSSSLVSWETTELPSVAVRTPESSALSFEHARVHKHTKRVLLSDEDYESAYEYCEEDNEYNQMIVAQDCHGVGEYVSQ